MITENTALKEQKIKKLEATNHAGESAYQSLFRLAECANRVFSERNIPLQMTVQTPEVKQTETYSKAFTFSARLSEKIHLDTVQLTTKLEKPLLTLTYAKGLVDCAAGSPDDSIRNTCLARAGNDPIVNKFIDKWLNTNLGGNIAKAVRMEEAKPSL